MDATRLGLTFQEAQAVLRNIRNRHNENKPKLPIGYEHKIKNENDFELNSNESPYFGVPDIFQKSKCSTSSQNSQVSIALKCSQVKSNPCFGNGTWLYELDDNSAPGGSSWVNPQFSHRGKNAANISCLQLSAPFDEQTKRNPRPDPSNSSLIAKRLRELKHPASREEEQQDQCRMTPERGINTEKGWRKTNNKAASCKTTKTAKSPPVKIINPEGNTVSKMGVWKSQPKGEKRKELLKTVMHQAGNQTDITSYLPKVKTQKKNAKVDPRTEDSTSEKLEKEGARNIRNMSFEDREIMKKRILGASNIACTLVYADGSTLLHPAKLKSLVKATCLSFSEKVECSLGDCFCILFPLPVEESSSEYTLWLRDFFFSLMVNQSNKIIYDAQKFIKTLLKVLSIEDLSVCFHWRCFDPKIASWLLDPDHPPEHFDALLRNGFGKDERPSKKLNDGIKGNEDMFNLLSLIPDMFLALQEKKLWELFSQVEMKICPILAVMELVGVEIDKKLLLDYSKILEKKIKILEQKSCQSVGHEFQMSSTQQLRQVLFNELQLDKKVQKRLARTQIKNYKSTSENVLKHLQDFHPLPKIVLEYRSITKVKSAYVDGILGFVQNDVLCTNWNQTCTGTGRLTSTNPNIQAIPKTQLDVTDVAKPYIGKDFETISITPRRAFKSRPGWSFISSDFQSIELRLLAHFSEDPLLLHIFNESNDDVFVQLASAWLSVDPKSVRSEDRERAKRVVYSVVYGVGKERLAETLNVSADQAKSFTTSFLATFTGLKLFIQSCINECRKQGCVTTIFGRQRLLPGINSNDTQLRAQSERQAVNFVIQGSAADICKMGMISVVQSLENKDLKMKSRLLIQIHDELVLEVQDDCVESVKELVKVCLEDTNSLCGGHVKLKVGMKVSVSFGKTWADMKPDCVR